MYKILHDTCLRDHVYFFQWCLKNSCHPRSGDKTVLLKGDHNFLNTRNTVHLKNKYKAGTMKSVNIVEWRENE